MSHFKIRLRDTDSRKDTDEDMSKVYRAILPKIAGEEPYILYFSNLRYKNDWSSILMRTSHLKNEPLFFKQSFCDTFSAHLWTKRLKAPSALRGRF